MATTPVVSSELQVDFDTFISLELGYGYGQKGGEAPRGGTGRRRIMV